MRALILAGGLGTRLRAMVADRPKPMAIVNQRPFLEYLLDYWISQGVSEFILSIGYLGEVIVNHFRDRYHKVPITYVKESKPLQTGGAIYYALKQSPKTLKPTFIMNGDTFLELDAQAMLKKHQESKAALTVALREVELNDRYDSVHLEGNQITSFKSREQEVQTRLINGGTYLISEPDSIFKGFQEKEVFSFENEVLPQAVQHCSVAGYVTKGKFIDIGIPKDYERSQTFFHHATSSS